MLALRRAAGLVTALTPRAARGIPASLGVVPRTIWLIMVLHLMVVLVHTVVFPNFRAPDERLHVDLIVLVERGEAWPWPDPGTIYMTEGSSAGGFTRSNRLPTALHLSEESIPPRGERPTFSDNGGTEPVLDGPNQLVQHPPLYYLLGAGVLHLIPGWENTSFDRVYMILRWWNALLMAGLPLLLYATARRLRLPEPVPTAAALAPLAIPELTHTAASVNNDNLLIMLCAAVALLTARVMTGDTSRGTAATIGVLGTLALLTKGFALMVPVWVALAYLVAGWRSHRRPAAVGLLVAGATMLPGLAWWIRNRIVYGALQPHGTHTDYPDMTPRFGGSDGGGQWLMNYAERMVTLFFVHDHTGTRVHNESWWIARVALMLLVAGILMALLRRVLPRPQVLVMLTPAAACAAIVAKGSWAQFAANHHLAAGMQGRYLYAGVVGLLVVAVAAALRLPGRWRWATPLAMLGFASLMQTIYLVNTAGLHWVPREGPTLSGIRRSLVAMAYWYPFPSLVLLLVVAGTVVAGTMTLAATARLARVPATAAVSPVSPAVAVPSTRGPRLEPGGTADAGRSELG